MIGLETLYSCLQTTLTDLPVEQLIEMLTTNNRKIVGLPIPQIKEGEIACITLFNPNTTYTFDETMIKSKSKNSAFIGQRLTGKVIGIINGDKIEMN